MKKAQLIKQIVTTLMASLDTLEKAARASHAEATHESSKAENKYDTRGLEAAYLADGQARQVREIVDSIKIYEALVAREFTAGEGGGVDALGPVNSRGGNGDPLLPAEGMEEGGVGEEGG